MSFEEPTKNCIEEVAVRSSLSFRRKTAKFPLISKKKKLSAVVNSIIITILWKKKNVKFSVWLR